jgi:tRNA nucleotidyltransferase (CCA-adding enzyme)
MKLKELLMLIESTANKIGSSTPFICGGIPRDKYINRLDRISDIDLTTGDNTIHYLAQEVELKLKKKYSLIKREMNDGHTSIYIGNIKIDFSSNFILNNIDRFISKFRISNPTNLQKEMFSRDFTCNSLLMSLDLKTILDPTNMGFKDLNSKLIRTCLSPEVTLLSNKNRVIRSIYLACKLDFEIDKSIIDFVSKNPESVNIASKKTLTKKINEAFHWNSDKAYSLITEMNLWNHIPISEKIFPYYEKFLKYKK